MKFGNSIKGLAVKYKKELLITGISLAVISTSFGVASFHEATHFQTAASINGISVGGMTPLQATEHLSASTVKNDVYVNEKLVLNGEDTLSGFSSDDLPRIKKLLSSQSFFQTASSDYFLEPVRSMEKEQEKQTALLKTQLLLLNKQAIPPKNASVAVVSGNIVVSESEPGTQYDIDRMMKEYDSIRGKTVISLPAIYLEPIQEDSESIKKATTQLKTLLGHTISYKVQEKTHELKGIDLIKNAHFSPAGTIVIDPKEIQQTLSAINKEQSTLNKPFLFQTHRGKQISVNGKTYGWTLNIEKESKNIQSAFLKGTSSLSASHTRGNGWGHESVGFQNVVNHGIGNSYAEVSLSEQRMWIYKNGQMVFTTNVVTGRESTNEATYKGVWYILYREAPSTLSGTSAGTAYEVEVDYWAPFTNDGQGFHDASWRTNWSPSAYHQQGSAGCVNVPVHAMKSVFDNLRRYTPVIVY